MPLCGITETLSDVESVRVVHINGDRDFLDVSADYFEGEDAYLVDYVDYH